MSVAVIGQGFVGGSLTTVLTENGETVFVYDKAGKVAKGGISEFTWPGVDDYHVRYARPGSLQEFVKSCESTSGFAGIYFVCLPTPMFEDGEADLSIIEDTLDILSSVPYNSDFTERIVVIKSTVPPGSTDKWNEKYSSTGIHVVFNPEFLTESNALNDMRNQTRIILGGPRPWINTVKSLFQRVFPRVPIVKTSSTTAEMVKYFTNIQLAVRVILSCEFWQICQKLDETGFNIDYDKVVEYARLDPRLGDSHMNVPGLNGIPGARGHCVPGETTIKISGGGTMRMEEVFSSFSNGNEIEVVSCNSSLTETNSKRILDAVRNKHDGELITVGFGDQRFTCTPDHLIPVERYGTLILARAQDIKEGDLLFVNVDE